MTRYRHVTGHVTNTLPYFLFRFELKKTSLTMAPQPRFRV